MLTILCAGADGEDEAGRATLGDLPPDVEPQIMAGATTQFMCKLVELGGEIRSRNAEPDPELWDALLDDALRRLRSPRTPG